MKWTQKLRYKSSTKMYNYNSSLDKMSMNAIYINKIHVITRKSCHSSISFGLPEILTLSWQGWRCAEGLVIQKRCPRYFTVLSLISSLTKFDLEWPTPLMTSVYSDHHSSMVAPIKRTIGSKIKHNNKPLTIDNNLYNSKPMAVISHIPVYMWVVITNFHKKYSSQ